MDISTKATIALSIASFVLALISISSAVCAIKQGNKALEASTRPYIAVSYHSQVVDNQQARRYIMVKNYGQTGAILTHISSDAIDINGFSHQLDSLNGSFFAPGQSFLYYYGKPKEGSEGIVTFKYSYNTPKKRYSEKINIKMSSGKIVHRSNEDCAIKYTLQEISERLI